MKIAESWLREWVNPDLDTEALAERLTMAGHEVDGIEFEGQGLDGVVVAEAVVTEEGAAYEVVAATEEGAVVEEGVVTDEGAVVVDAVITPADEDDGDEE